MSGSSSNEKPLGEDPKLTPEKANAPPTGGDDIALETPIEEGDFNAQTTPP